MSLRPIYKMDVMINHVKESILQFDPGKTDYDLEVPDDCSALLFRLNYDPAFRISITADRDAGRYGFSEIDQNVDDYRAGAEAPYYDYYKGYILRLDKRSWSFDEDLHETAWITAASGEFGSFTYKIHIFRPNNYSIRQKFTQGIHHDMEFNLNVPYELYVPSNYDPARSYPLVIAFHGTGEIKEPTDAILRKSHMATAWAYASENNTHPCIVLAPQCTIRYDENDNWTTIDQFLKHRTDSPFYPMPQLKAAWTFVEHLMQKYNIDEKRIYLTGVSSGSFAASVCAEMHPGKIAALVEVCGALDPAKIDNLRGTSLWLIHAEDDPVLPVTMTLNPIEELLQQHSIPYRTSLYPAGQVFWRSGHFVWEPAYRDQAMIDWVFDQHL
ncbi:MAG: hypothetical protein VZR02_04370 [Lachnospiraceae bacterium]|nr:hypothetical protein [Lachnospiraceae bacterium]